MDLYSYTNGDPINFIDPTGRGAEGGQAGPNSFSPTSSRQDTKWKRSFWADMYRKHGYNHPKYGPKSNRVDIVPVIEFLPTKWDTWKEIQTMEEFSAYMNFGPNTSYGLDKDTALALQRGLGFVANVLWSFIPGSGFVDYHRVLNDPNASNFDVGMGYADAAMSFGFGVFGAFKAIGKFRSVSSEFGSLRYASSGSRNSVPLTQAQFDEVVAYGLDVVFIGDDVLPGTGFGLSANARVSMRGALAHEIIGHQGAFKAGRSLEAGSLLDEVQASWRAAKLAPGLTKQDRYLLMRDAVERIRSAGLKTKDIDRALIYLEP